MRQALRGRSFRLILTTLAVIGVLTVAFSVSPVFAANDTSLYPDPAIEARTARELLALEAQIRQPYQGSVTDNSIIPIVTSLARLGRLEAALRVAGHIQIQEADVVNGAPQTRAEVLRLVVRRRCVLGNIEEASQLLPAIKVPAARADALLSLARAYLRRGEVDHARKTLYQASPLVQGQINATSYTAYLLARSGDLGGAKRLFARAEARLAPLHPLEPASSAATSKSEQRWQDTQWKNMQANSERRSLSHYLLKSGLADEAIRMEQTIVDERMQRPFLHVALLNNLVAVNRFDIAQRLARADGGYNEVNVLVLLAVMLDQRKGDRDGALKLLAEAEEAYRALPTEPAHQLRHRAMGDADLQETMLILLSYGYRELDQEGPAQQRLNEAVAGASPGKAASLRVMAATFPLIMARENRRSLSPAQLQNIDAEITPHLRLLYAPNESYHLLRWLVEAQIQAGQLEAARRHLPLLERFTVALIPAARDINGFRPAMEVARQWREVGDEAQARKLLQTIYAAPKPMKVTRRDRAHAMIRNGFVDEGLSKLTSLPALPNDKRYFPKIAFWQAKYQPRVFPERLLRIKAPRERLEELVDFTKGLTEPIYEIAQERELVLSTGGHSSSY